MKIILDNFQSGACNVNPLLRNLEYDNPDTKSKHISKYCKNFIGY